MFVYCALPIHVFNAFSFSTICNLFFQTQNKREMAVYTLAASIYSHSPLFCSEELVVHIDKGRRIHLIQTWLDVRSKAALKNLAVCKPPK